MPVLVFNSRVQGLSFSHTSSALKAEPSGMDFQLLIYGRSSYYTVSP